MATRRMGITGCRHIGECLLGPVKSAMVRMQVSEQPMQKLFRYQETVGKGQRQAQQTAPGASGASGSRQHKKDQEHQAADSIRSFRSSRLASIRPRGQQG